MSLLLNCLKKEKLYFKTSGVHKAQNTRGGLCLGEMTARWLKAEQKCGLFYLNSSGKIVWKINEKLFYWWWRCLYETYYYLSSVESEGVPVWYSKLKSVRKNVRKRHLKCVCCNLGLFFIFTALSWEQLEHFVPVMCRNLQITPNLIYLHKISGDRGKRLRIQVERREAVL